MPISQSAADSRDPDRGGPRAAALVAGVGGRRQEPVDGACAGTPGVVEVTRFGAASDGQSLATEGLQPALDACGSAGRGPYWCRPDTT
jgi:hypothetical protein